MPSACHKLLQSFYATADKLSHLARTRRLKKAFALEAVDRIVQSMPQLIDNELAQRSGVIALENAGSCIMMQGCTYCPFDDDAVEAVLGAMRRYKDNADIQRSGAGALNFMIAVFVDTGAIISTDEEDGDEVTETEVTNYRRLSRPACSSPPCCCPQSLCCRPLRLLSSRPILRVSCSD